MTSLPPSVKQQMDPLAYTALPIAAARAVAHSKSNAHVNDPLAAKLVAGESDLIRAGANVEHSILLDYWDGE